MMHKNKTDLWNKQTPFLEESYSFLRKPKCKLPLIGTVKSLQKPLNESHNKYEHQWDNIPVPGPMKCKLYSIWKYKENEYNIDSVLPMNDVSLMTQVQEKSSEEIETDDILKELQHINRKGKLRKKSIIHHLINPCTFDKVFPTHKNSYKCEPKNETNSCMKDISKKSETTVSETTNDEHHLKAVPRMVFQTETVKKKISNKKVIRDGIKESLEYRGRKKLLRTLSHMLIQNNPKRSRRVKEKPYWNNFHQQKPQTLHASPSQRWLQKFTCFKKNNQSYEQKPETPARNKSVANFRKLKGRHPSNVWHHHFSLGHRKYKNLRLKTNSDSQIEKSFVKRKKITVQHPLGYSSSTTDEPGAISYPLIGERESAKKYSSKKVKNKTKRKPKLLSLENKHFNHYKGSSNEHSPDSEIDVPALKPKKIRIKRGSDSSIAGVEHLSEHEKDYISEKSVVETIPDSSFDIHSSCSEGGRYLTHQDSKSFRCKNSFLNSNSSTEEDSPNKQVVNTNKRLFKEKEVIVSSNLKQTKETQISQILIKQNIGDKSERDDSEEHKNPTINKITVLGRNCSIILEPAREKSAKTSHTSSSKNIDLDNQKLDKNPDKTDVYINFCYEQSDIQRSTSTSNITSHDLIRDVNSAPQQIHKSKTSTTRVALNSTPESESGSCQKGGFVKRCTKKMLVKNSKDSGKAKGKNMQKKITYKIKRKGARILSNKVTQCPSPFISTGTQTKETSIYREKCPLDFAINDRIGFPSGHHHHSNTHRMHQLQKPYNRDSFSSYHQEFSSRSSKPMTSSSYHVPCSKGKEYPQSYTKQKFSINLMGRNMQTERKLIKQEISTNRQNSLHQSSSMETTCAPHRSSKSTRRSSFCLEKSHKTPRMTPEVYSTLVPQSKSMGNVCKYPRRYSSSSSDSSHSFRRTRRRSAVRHSTRKESPANYNHNYTEKSWNGHTKMPHQLSHSQIFHNSNSSFVPYPNHQVKSHHSRPEENYCKRSKDYPHGKFQESYKRSGVAMPSYYNMYGRGFMS